jgi:hypothetical protein
MNKHNITLKMLSEGFRDKEEYVTESYFVNEEILNSTN